MIDVCISSFLGKYHETKMGKHALEIISCMKIRTCSLKNIAPRHFKRMKRFMHKHRDSFPKNKFAALGDSVEG